MKQKFKHLSLLEREKLYGGLKEGKSLRDVAKTLGRNHTSLSRELKSNTKYGKAYIPCLAQRRAERVGFRQRHHAPLKNPEIFLLR
jgi:IS30 family transposase